MKLIIEIDEDDYTMCQILAKEMCGPRLKLTDNLKYAISNGIPLDKIRAEISEFKDDKIIHAERNEMIDIVLGIIDKYRNEVTS